jgi:hypothetical protein
MAHNLCRLCGVIPAKEPPNLHREVVKEGISDRSGYQREQQREQLPAHYHAGSGPIESGANAG